MVRPAWCDLQGEKRVSNLPLPLKCQGPPVKELKCIAVYDCGALSPAFIASCKLLLSTRGECVFSSTAAPGPLQENGGHAAAHAHRLGCDF